METEKNTSVILAFWRWLIKMDTSEPLPWFGHAWGGEARFTTLRDAIARRQDYSRQLDASAACDGPFWARLLAPFKTSLSCAARFFFVPLLISFYSWLRGLYSRFFTRVRLSFICNYINGPLFYYLICFLFFFFLSFSSNSPFLLLSFFLHFSFCRFRLFFFHNYYHFLIVCMIGIVLVF
jgi:hypothetical protein